MALLYSIVGQEAEDRQRRWGWGGVKCGSWGGGSKPPPHQLGAWGSAVSSPSGGPRIMGREEAGKQLEL